LPALLTLRDARSTGRARTVGGHGSGRVRPDRRSAFDPFAWSAKNGIDFVSLRDFTADEAAMRRFLEEKPEVWSATLLRDGRRHFVIYNPVRSQERLRSDLTHKVAHFKAEHDPSPAWTSEDSKCDGGSKGQENETAELAGALLVPRAKARLAAIRDISPERVAARYRVSVDMAIWRMRMSGGYKIRASSQKKWRPRYS
jgi:hypothetical protein